MTRVRIRSLRGAEVCFLVGRPHFGQKYASVEMGFPQSGQSTSGTQ